MANVYIVYSGDAWLSSASMEMKGIFDSKEKAVKATIEAIKKSSAKELKEMALTYWEEPFEEEDDFNMVVADLLEEIENMLNEDNQTQGFDTSYMIEVGELNEWWQ